MSREKESNWKKLELKWHGKLMKMTWHVVHDMTRRNDDMTSNICHRKQRLQLSLYTLTRKSADYTFWWNEMWNWFCCCCCCCLFAYLVHCNSSVIIYVPSTKDSRYILSFAIWDSWKKNIVNVITRIWTQVQFCHACLLEGVVTDFHYSRIGQKILKVYHAAYQQVVEYLPLFIFIAVNLITGK